MVKCLAGVKTWDLILRVIGSLWRMSFEEVSDIIGICNFQSLSLVAL